MTIYQQFLSYSPNKQTNWAKNITSANTAEVKRKKKRRRRRRRRRRKNKRQDENIMVCPRP